jgi:serine protease
LLSNFRVATLFHWTARLALRLPARPLPSSPRRPVLAAVAALALLAPASAAHATTHVPGEVIVQYRKSADGAQRAAAQRAAGVGSPRTIAARTRVLKIEDGRSVDATVAELRRLPQVKDAAPNAVAHVSGFIPRDPGRSGDPPGDWQSVQWNFDGPFGVGAPDAWSNLIKAGRPGGRGVTVAVLDTGVAYERHGRYRRSPDFNSGDFVRGYDFVDNDSHPNDENGHGTHVAGTIGEATDNSVGVTGLAYGARIMPVRVLDSVGSGDSVTISAGIRYAVKHHANVINLSFEFDSNTTSRDVPDLLAALRYARAKGVLVVAAAGNEGSSALAYPARAQSVLSVGATTEHGCVADYSNAGSSLDIVAPGGGPDAALDEPQCDTSRDGRNVVQMTFRGSVRSFGLPGDYTGTSMATPHVSAAAALVIASGVLGPHPSPGAIIGRLKATARPLGPARHYGAGLLDAAAATAPAATSSGR